MRARAFLPFVLTAMLAGAGAAHSSGQIVVRPALTAPEAAAAAQRGTPWRGPVMDDASARAMAERARRERVVPHRVAPAGYDWRDDARRARPARNPHTPVPANAAPAVVSATPPETIRVAFIRIDFLADAAGAETSGDGKFDLSGPDTSVAPIDRPPHNRSFYQAHLEALQRYYDVQSYGRVVVVGDVWPRSENGAYHCHDMADFGKWRFSQDVYGQAVRMFRDMMFAADTQSTQMGDRIPWDTYDRFNLIHAGSDFQSDIRGDSPYDIPSFTIGVGDTDVVVFRDSTNVPIDRATIVPETVNQDGYYATLNGVLAHENGHNFFGFADLYDIETGYPVVGYWSLMDSGNLLGTQVQLPDGEIIYAVGLLPPSVDPFQRFFTTDALQFRDVAWGETTDLENSQRHPDVRRLWMTSDEYLLIENRAILAGDTLTLDQDSTTKVILGPETPDRFEYDALQLGSGVLIWHIDASVIPFETSPRANPDYGWNSNPGRLGIEVIEADRLDDLGDPGSPFILGAPYDPWFVGNNTVLADSTIPPMRPHIGTAPHARLEVLDPPLATMRILAQRAWERSGWPVHADFPPEGPELLAVDADGDGQLEVCWAGGGGASGDSAAVFAVRPNGQGLFDPVSFAFATLDARPLQPLAASWTGPVPARRPQDGQAPPPPSLFAVTTRVTGADPEPGGRLWILDHTGAPQFGSPIALLGGALATTPPVYAGGSFFVGASDGHIYEVDALGQLLGSPDGLSAPVRGRLAISAGDEANEWLIAAGTASGEVRVFDRKSGGYAALSGWPRQLTAPGASSLEPEFLWLDFDTGARPAGSTRTCAGGRTLIVHDTNRLWAYCESGEPLPGWGRVLPDTLITGLAAGDVDRDGYLEVIAQTRHSGIVYFNQSGAPSPGWPEPTTRERLPAGTPLLAVDVDGSGFPEMVGVDGSGRLNALRPDTHQPAGWPLGVGAEARGSLVAADLDGDGTVEIVAPDRPLPDSLQFEINGRFSSLHAWSVPGAVQTPLASPWRMLGYDPGRSSSLPAQFTPNAPAAAGGPYVRGSLKAYPNPARQKPVAFAFQLTEPARVDVEIVDTSGHKVAGFGVDGLQSDNVAVWDPGRLPAGLYLARVRFRGTSGDHSEVIQVGVIR